MFARASRVARATRGVSASGFGGTNAWAPTSSLLPSRQFSASSRPSVVLLYSGGLDTSTILMWLIDQGYDVHAFVADLGQPEDYEAIKAKAAECGAVGCHVVDLRRDFLENYIYPTVQANSMYENLYLLGTSIARPCISKKAVEIAQEMGCQAVAHGATGKGNDQVRFELSFHALDPSLECITPWRDPEFYERFQGRSDLLEYAASKGIPVTQTKAKPFSMDENMFHISYEAGVLEDPASPPPEGMFRMTVDPEQAPDEAAIVTVAFEQGNMVGVHNKTSGYSSSDTLESFLYLNEIGGAHGVGRVDVVENRFVGIKSRGLYETPGGEILRTAHIGLEGLCLDREVYRARDLLATRFTDSVYNGFWFSPEMDFLQHAIRHSQRNVTGEVDIKLFKGHASIYSRRSPLSLYDSKLVSMDEQGGYEPKDAAGFIKIHAHRLKAHAAREQRAGRNVKHIAEDFLERE